MITITTRPYLASEKQQLVRQLPSIYKRIEGFTMKFIFILMIFLVPFLLLDKYFHFSSNVQLYTCIVFLILTTIITQRITNKYEAQFGNKKVVEEVNLGLVEVIHVKTERAIKREDPDDYGIAFYIDVTDKDQRKCLYLWGQYLDDLEFDNLFPKTEFVITRRMDIKETIDIKLLGNPFKPENTLPAFNKNIWKSGKYPLDGELLAKTIDEVT